MRGLGLNQRHRIHWPFFLPLAAVTLIGPLTVHMYLPAVPAVQAGLGMSAATAQATFSVALFTMAVATLFYGPLSDRLGRRPVLLAGIALFGAGGLICVVAPDAPTF